MHKICNHLDYHFSRIVIIRSIYYRIKTHQKNKLNNQWQSIDFVIQNIKQIANLCEFYELNKHIPEIEHQVGRFINMCKIVNQLKPENKQTVVEFGTFQGLGLLLLDLAFTLRPDPLRNSSNQNFIGIDTFLGLPESSTVWTQGQFSNTSLDICEKNIRKWINPLSKFELIQGSFNDPNVIMRLSKYHDISIFHFDADLGSSTEQALQVVNLLLSKKESAYFLFDDWGCHPDEVPDAFHTWCFNNQNSLNFSVTKISSTKLSRYYRIDFI